MESRPKYSPGEKLLASGLIVLLGAAGCGGGSSGESPAKKRASARHELLALPAPSGNTPAALARSIGRLSRRAGVLRQESHDAGAVPSSFCKYDDNNPQPTFSSKPARVIIDSLCQPPLGAPVGVYADANFSSDLVGKVRDGDVVEANCIDPSGQTTTNVLGSRSQSSTWVEITEGKIEGYVSEVNVAYVNNSAFQHCDR
ncbi:MAG TPA: hypothetical protein VFH99_01015 [Candidatus Saccharimonadales bacterium]|nr:hypothetical protein [Candidatus Saccharimonadales bacterium]